MKKHRRYIAGSKRTQAIHLASCILLTAGFLAMFFVFTFLFIHEIVKYDRLHYSPSVVIRIDR